MNENALRTKSMVFYLIVLELFQFYTFSLLILLSWKLEWKFNQVIVQFQTPRMYCAANSDDLSEVIEYVKKIHPHVPLGATGISMGG